ncbi:hypothetical protein ACWEPM_36260 [Streptomyces sp. NPDC004244]
MRAPLACEHKASGQSTPAAVLATTRLGPLLWLLRALVAAATGIASTGILTQPPLCEGLEGDAGAEGVEECEERRPFGGFKDMVQVLLDMAL